MLTARRAAASCPAHQRPGLPNQRPRRLPTCRANYRWSADADGGRKRESLYGFDDRGEPPAGGGGGNARQGDGMSGAHAADDTAAGAWTAGDAGSSIWQQAADWGQPPQSPAGDAETLQAEWEAAAATISSERAARRAARRAAGGGRLSRRQQQGQEQQEQQQGQEQGQQAAWGQAPGPPREEEPAGAAAAGSEAAPAGDPWVEADLRLLRRRQRAAAGRRRGTIGDGAAGAAGAADPGAGQLGGGGWGGPVPEPWAAEWGPASPAASSPAAEDWGWAEESWAQDGGRRQRQRQQQQELRQQAAADAGPGSTWDFAQQQAELLRRRRRRRRSGAGGEAEDAGAGSAAYAAGQQAQQQQAWGWAGGAQPAGGYAGPGADYDYLDSSEEEDDEELGQQGQGPEYSAEFEPGLTAEPDIAVLSTDELDRMLPVVPFSQQAAFFSGSAADSVQRWGASLAATVVLSKVAVLAASSLTWPLWWPWALAAKKNLAIRRQYRYGGLWRTRVLGVTFTGRPKPFGPSADPGGLLGGSTMRLARVLVGDPEGAQTELVLPYDARYELIQPGEPAELVVLSADPSFQQFKAVKDVYLPSSGLWVSEYPHADRTQFLEVSLQVEREAQEVAGA
ncbi:hypothetical protein ABPG75_006311 [Micractinium tetrahymenae]